MEGRKSGGGLSIVIPAWNEEDRLQGTLSRYLPALEARSEPFEIIVVADGACDRTPEVAEKYSERHVRVLRFPDKLGKGGAVLAGFREARYEFIGYLDADGPISPSQLASLVASLKEVDCVVASRWVRGATGVEAEPIFNRIAGRAWNLLTRSLLFLPLKDTQCGAKFFQRSVIGSLIRTVALTNRAFDVAILFHIRKSGKRVREVGVDWTHDNRSRMPIGRAIPIMFASLLGVRLINSRLGRHVPSRFVQWFLGRFGGS